MSTNNDKYVVSGAFADPVTFVTLVMRMLSEPRIEGGYEVELTSVLDELASRRDDPPTVLKLKIRLSTTTHGENMVVQADHIDEQRVRHPVMFTVFRDHVAALYRS